MNQTTQNCSARLSPADIKLCIPMPINVTRNVFLQTETQLYSDIASMRQDEFKMSFLSTLYINLLIIKHCISIAHVRSIAITNYQALSEINLCKAYDVYSALLKSH